MKIDVILEPDLTVDEVRELGLLGESLGIHGLWVQNYSAAMDPFMSLVPLAQDSSRIRLGVVLVSPQELHPLKLSNCLLTLNELSRGRASVAIGRGGDWIGSMGGDFTPHVEALRDAVTIVRQLAQGAGRVRPFSYSGKHYQARYFRTPWLGCDTAPVVYAGVTLDRMLNMAAEVADGVMLADLGLPRVAAGRVAVVQAALQSAGRSRGEFRINDFVGWHVKQDANTTYREARRELVIRAWLSPQWLRPFLSEDEVSFVQTHKNAFVKAHQNRTDVIEGIPADIVERIIDGLTITAPLSEIDRALARIREFEDAGVDELALRIHDDPADSIRLIGKHVIPAFS
jgi:alkanesulfonate monooxygenase SsuD/methylene tetrahydromethanopterin reductase-like flavin-dependent oxidoreductase (luciferase family)